MSFKMKHDFRTSRHALEIGHVMLDLWVRDINDYLVSFSRKGMLPSLGC